MLLYHGTNERVAKLALKEGLLPRDESESEGNWEHTVPSRSDLVYVTRAYAPYFASCAAKKGRWGIVEIDSDKLSRFAIDGFTGLLPDEDFLEQGSRRMKPEEFAHLNSDERAELAACKTMEERTIWFRDYLETFAHLWQNSIDKMGNAAHLGAIEPGAIVRVSLFEPRSNSYVAMACIDPMISIMNYMICGMKYRSFTDWFFRLDEDVVRGILEGIGPEPSMTKEMRALLEQRDEYAREQLAQRSGLEVIENEGYNRG
jgi:hypothetical protein